MSKFLANKRLNNTIKIPTGSDYIHVFSFNKESLLELDKQDLKTPYILIVGTLTPPDGRIIKNKGNEYKGYFYCSEDNGMYGLIGKDLKEAKDNFRNVDSSYKEKIKKILRQNGIVFLDVVSEAWSKKDSANDNDIEKYSLDYNSFSKIDVFKVKKVIANSINAYEALRKISENDECDNIKALFKNKKVVLIPQQIRGYYDNPKGLDYKPTYSNPDELENEWKDQIKIRGHIND